MLGLIRNISLLFIFISCLGSYLLLNNAYAFRVENTVWGDEKIDDPLIEKLLDSDIMIRLKYIDQSGPGPYLNFLPKFSRYEHSIGVWALLRKSGASLKEQVAGLLHDVSHTAFSHVADHFFYHSNVQKSYQDIIHLSYLRQVNIEELLGNTDIKIDDLRPDLPEYKRLEQDLPNLCADRIQYNIQTGIIMRIITHQEAQEFIQHLDFQDGRWFFDDQDIARKFADLSLYFTRNLWGAEWNFVLYHNFTRVLRRAIDLGLLSEEDFRYGTDQDIFDKIHNFPDNKLQALLNLCKQVNTAYRVTAYDKSELHYKPKFRGIDPLVCQDNKCLTLRALDQVFAQEYEKVYQWCERGYGIVLSE